MKRVYCLFPLVLCLLLVSCAPAVQEPTPPPGEEDAPQPFLRIDGTEVPQWHYLYWLRCALRRAEENGLLASGAAPDGRSLTAYVKDQALADTVLYATVRTWAARYGCTLDETDQALIQSQWDTLCIAYGGEEAYLQSLGLTREQAWELAEDGRRYARLSTFFCTDAPSTGSGETAAEFSEKAGLSQADERIAAQAYFDHMLCTAAAAARVETSPAYDALSLTALLPEMENTPSA